MSIIRSGIIKFSSKQRNDKKDRASNFKINLGNGGTTQNVLSSYVGSVSFANTQYNINKTNNTMGYNDGFVNKFFDIPVGQYDLNSLMASVEAGFLAETPSITIDFQLDALTKKLKIVSSSASFTLFDYLTGDVSTLASVLGIRGLIGTNVLPKLMPDVPDLSGLTMVFIDSQTISAGPSVEVIDRLLVGANSPIVNNQTGNIVVGIGCSSPFGFYVHWENVNETNLNVYQTPKNFTVIDIKLLDLHGNEIELNGSDVEIVLHTTY